MSRMKLAYDKVISPDNNEFGIFPIFEFDMEKAITDGIISWTRYGESRPVYNPNPGDSILYDDFTATSTVLNTYLPSNIPHQPYMEGDIFESSLSPYVLDDGIYIPNPDYSMQSITVGEKPDDWDIASNIFQYTYPAAFTVDNVEYRYQCWHNVRRGSTYDATALYYRDKNRKMLKLFYTYKGYSFSLYRGGGRSSSSTYYPFRYTTGGDCLGADISVAGYSFTNIMLEKLRKYNSGSSGVRSDIAGNTYTPNNDTERALVLTGNLASLGAKCAIFIHYTKDGQDFYGIGELNYDSYSEDAQPTTLKVMAFTSDFWGGSIIAGGGGGSWGYPSSTGGGDGTFSSPSDNRGHGTDQDFTNPTTGIMKVRQTKLNGVMQSVGIKYYGMRKEPNESIDRMSEIIDWMFDPQHSFMSRFTQSLFNPISGVLSCHLIPSDFYEVFASDVHVIISGYDFTQEMTTAAFQNPVTAPIVQTITHKHFEAYDIGKHFGAFPDFEPYTRFVLHLPYIGNVEIAANAISQGSIAVDYMCDVMNGNVCAFVWCSDRDGHSTYRYTATGNCAVSIPMYNTNQDFSGVGKIANGAISLIGMARSPISGAISAATGILSGIYDLANMHQSTNFAGTLSGNIGMISDLVVWLEAVRPVWVQPESYQNLEGVPLQMSGTIETISVDGEYLSGYTEISKIELDNVDATDSEKREIERLLLSGVWIARDRF